MTCVTPVYLNPEEQISKVTTQAGNSVVFLGHPSLLYNYGIFPFFRHFLSTRLSLSQLSSFSKVQISPEYILHVQRFFNYFISVSLGLAVINMSPIYYFDCQWVCKATVDILFPALSECYKAKISKVIISSTSSLFIFNCLLSLFYLKM